MKNTSILTDKQFADFSHVIFSHLGIKMPPAKKVMLQSRLHRRIRELKMNNLHDYYAWFFSDEQAQNEELEHLLNLATTNKTDFFREPKHFDLLINQVFPDWCEKGLSVPFRLWSAGCSSGEEAYTMAMLLLEATSVCRYDFSILATDISTQILRQAMQAVYPEARIRPVPLELRKKYLLRNRNSTTKTVRMAPEVRKKVRFGKLNFQSKEYGLREKLDVIFFRNVMIYFTQEDQQQIVLRMCRSMRPGGYLFIGHSESLNGLDLPIQSVSPAVYRYTP